MGQVQGFFDGSQDGIEIVARLSPKKEQSYGTLNIKKHREKEDWPFDGMNFRGIEVLVC